MESSTNIDHTAAIQAAIDDAAATGASATVISESGAPIDPTAQGDGAGDPSTSDGQLETAAIPFDDARSIAQKVKDFFVDLDEDVKAAFHGEILGQLDALGSGAALSIDGSTVAISAYHAGRRFYGHGTTVAAALADFHTNAGPREESGA